MNYELRSRQPTVWRFSHMLDHHENTNVMYQLIANTLCEYRMVVYVYTTKHAAAAAAAGSPLGRNSRRFFGLRPRSPTGHFVLLVVRVMFLFGRSCQSRAKYNHQKSITSILTHAVMATASLKSPLQILRLTKSTLLMKNLVAQCKRHKGTDCPNPAMLINAHDPRTFPGRFESCM